MKLFTDFTGKTVDLDDLGIYSGVWKKMNINDLFSKCMSAAGDSLFYMKFLHPEFSSQQQRVDILCKELSNIWHFVRKFDLDAYECTMINEDKYRAALMEWLYRFQDEVENQC